MLLGAAAQIRSPAAVAGLTHRDDIATIGDAARHALGADGYRSAWAAGAALDRREILDLARRTARRAADRQM
jgi:hypothetical protein